MKLYLSSIGKPLLHNGTLALIGALAGGGTEPPPPVGSGTLTLADFTRDLTPYQRLGTSRDIDVAGTCDPALKSIQVRAVTALGAGTPFTSWTTIPAVNGSYLGKINVPQSDWCWLEAFDGTNTVRTTKRFGVGVIGLLIGQSNMENRPKTAYKSPLGDRRAIESHRTKGLRRLGNYNDSMPANTLSDKTGYSAGLTIQTDARGDGYVYVANLLAQALSCIVCLVERARSGSNILDWVGLGTVAGDKWGEAAAAITDLGGDCEFALWLQGETNANLMSTADMVTHLGSLQGRCHTLTGRTASNFHFGVMSLGAGSYGGSSEGEFGNMRAAHVQFGNNTPGAFFAGAIHDAQTSDGVHLNGEAHARIGARNIHCLLSRLGFGPSGAGPRITSAAWDGSGVVLTLQHSGGTALLDGAGGNGSALTGHEFKRTDGTIVPYTASLITGPNTIRFAMPEKPATASYAMMNNPHNLDPNDAKTAVVFASCVYDNVAIQGSTVGCPIQPLAALAVT